MPVGNISEVSRIEWNLLNFWHLDTSDRIQSPAFTSLGCSWSLEISDDGDTDSESFLICLVRIDSHADFTPKNVAFLGIRLSDGTVEQFKGSPCYNPPFFKIKKDDIMIRKLQLLPSGTLTVTCRFASGSPTPEKVEPNPSAIETQQWKLVELEDLSSDFKDLLKSERKCDVTVNVQGKEFRAHRAVLSARSSVFRAMYEHETSEDKTGYLTIPDCDPESFGDFLIYIYTGKLEEISFRTACNLYPTAEKYDVQKLKSFCTEHMARNLAVENVCEAVILADQYGDDKLTCSTQEFFNKNFLKIFQTSEWKAMLRNNVRLADRILSELDPAPQKEKCHRTK